MGICYKKLWKLLIDKDMKRKSSLLSPALARLPSLKWAAMVMLVQRRL